MMGLFIVKLVKVKLNILKTQKDIYYTLLATIFTLYLLTIYPTLIQQEHDILKTIYASIPVLIFCFALYSFTIVVDLICGYEIRTFHFGELSEILNKGIFPKAKKIPFFFIDVYVIFFGVSLAFVLVFNPFLSSSNLDLSNLMFLIISQLVLTLVYTMHIVYSLDRRYKNNLEDDEPE